MIGRLLRRTAVEAVVCPRCDVTYRPALTRGSCPVCDADPSGAPATAPAQRDLLLPIVLVATVVNVLLLGTLAIAVAHVG